MSEISTPRALPPVPPASRPNPVTSELAVKLLQPLEGLLAIGESAKAEVVGIKEVAQSFQLLLRLTLDSGRQTTLTATSAQPLYEGTTLKLTALPDTRLAVSLLASGEPALTRLDPSQLPSGTLLQARVQSSERSNPGDAQPAVYKVLVNLLNTSLAGSKLALESPLPLAPGSLLSARVDNSQALTFLPLSSRLGQLELSHQLGGQLARQGSLDGLFKALQGVAAQDGLPDGLRGSIDKLLGALPDAGQLSTSQGLGKALEDSGLLLEHRLLGGQGAGLHNDLKANLLRLIGQLLPNLVSASPLTPGNLGGTLAQALPVFARNALGALGQGASRQQALNFPLPSRLLADMEGEADLETLLKLAAAAVSRLQTHQLSSLAQTQVGPEGNLLTTWQLELPMRNHQELVPIQLKIQRDEPQDNPTKQEPREPSWRVELAFDLDSLGPLQVQVQLVRGSLSSQLWAERASTARLIDGELDNLRERFTNAGLTVGELACRQGVPPQGPRTTLEQRWVDETA